MTNEIPQQVKQATDRFRSQFEALRREIHKVIVGHHDVVEGVLVCLFTGGHALLEGVPGLGKTLLVRTLAEAMQLEFSRIQFTPDLMPADIIGTNIIMEDQATGRREFRFERGPLFAQIVLADEINRATPKTQSALLEAMQERQITVARQRYPLKPPFFVMATQNPIEQEGTYPLPEAQLDRFFFKLIVQYSGRSELNEILNRTTTARTPTVQPVMSGEEILASQQLVRNVALAPHVQDYAIRLTMATHPGGEFAVESVNKYVRWGSSPRGAQAIVLAAKVYALMDGRYNVSFDDARKAATPALRHRMLLNFEGEAEGIVTDTIVKDILEQLPTGAAAAAAGKMTK
jgi:MoxR-like ATPase